MTTYKTEGVPIVIVHRGRQDYLKACISKAKQHNRNSAIILIGDTSNSDLAQIHYNIDCENSPLLKDVAAFRRLYTHRSGLSSSFERFCIERWLLIRNLMVYLDLEICCAIDSDVLFFSGAQNILDEIPGLAMSFGRWNQKMLLPHFNLIQRRDALESFCIFAVEIYKNQSRLKKLSMESSADGGRTWICDMLLFWKWSQENPHFKLAIYEEQPSKNSYFDPSVGRTEGFTHSAFHLGIAKKMEKTLIRRRSCICSRCKQPPRANKVYSLSRNIQSFNGAPRSRQGRHIGLFLFDDKSKTHLRALPAIKEEINIYKRIVLL
jgi:hypothetical protein